VRYFLKLKDKKIEITEKFPVTIGNTQGNCKVKIDDKYVSRHQCTIVLTPKGVWLSDGNGIVSSRNGCQVNGIFLQCDKLREVDKGVELFNGDRIIIGTTSLEFFVEKSPKKTIESWKETSGFDFR